jgi:ABC-type multidrug transport system ATPase subunit
LNRLCDELLERVNLTHAAKRKVGGLSGGMLQRLGLAQAIAGDPRVLIVDEPTAGLDPEERLRSYHLLGELAENRIVLLSTHIVEDVSVLCPYFAIISRGKLIARSTPAAAREAISGTVYQGEVEAAELDSLRARHTVIQSLLFEGRNRVRINAPAGDPPSGFEAVEATLEDAYLSVARADGGILPELRPPLPAGEAA